MSQIIGGHVFVPLERNIDDVKLNSITSGATITSELISTQALATAATTNDYFLTLKAAGTLAKIVYDDLANSLASASGTVSAITSVRLRSFNAAGNPNFEVDQRNAGSAITMGAGTFVQDRWQATKTTGAMAATAQQQAGPVLLPGTNFAVSGKFLRITLSTVQASLAAGDLLWLLEQVEGIVLRELVSDVHSLSLLVRSSVSGLSFGASLRDAATTRSLVKLCTIPTANTWTVIPLANLPLWPAGATWAIGAGVVGYQLSIALASGSTYITPANDSWQNGNFVGAVGQSNFAASPVNSTFDIAFVQHEPGSQCTTLIDKPFSQNYDECLRYYQKTYPYGNTIGTVTGAGCLTLQTYPNANATGPVPFKKTMAKVPTTITGYSVQTGAANTVRDVIANVDRATAGANSPGDSGFSGFGIATVNAANTIYQFHYTADTSF